MKKDQIGLKGIRKRRKPGKMGLDCLSLGLGWPRLERHSIPIDLALAVRERSRDEGICIDGWMNLAKNKAQDLHDIDQILVAVRQGANRVQHRGSKSAIRHKRLSF